MNVTVVGIGNTLTADDGAGIEAVNRLAAVLADERVTCVVSERGGLELLDHLEGCSGAIIVDTARTGRHPAGYISIHTLYPTVPSPDLPSRHALSVDAALSLGAVAGLRLPGEITLFAVEAADLESVGGGYTPGVRKAVPQLVARLTARLRELLPDLQAATTVPTTS